MISYFNTDWVQMIYISMVLILIIPVMFMNSSIHHQKQSCLAEQFETREKLEFHKQMIPSRMITITDYETRFGYITSPNYPKPFEIDSNSLVHLVLRDNQTTTTLDAIRLTFEDINLEFSNHCESESIQILIEDQLLSRSKETDQRLHQQQKQFKTTKRAVFITCGTIPPKPLLILRSSLFIQLSSDVFNRGQNRGFKLKFEFLNSKLQLYDGCEQANQFMCRNRLCIPNNLRCNKIDDCGDGSDEDLSALCLDLPTIPYPIDYECGLIDNFNMENLDNNKLDATTTATTSNKPATTILTNRIIGGDLVKTYTNGNGLPFQVSIQLNRVEPISHICGGTLIHPMFVLSASHCFKGLTSISDYNFKFGLRDLRSTSVMSIKGRTNNNKEKNNVVQVRYANSISPYPGHGIFNIQDSSDGGGTSMNYGDLTNDFVLIELNAPVLLNKNVWPACLPHLAEPLVAGRECFASGFGDTRGSGNSFKLKQAKQIIIHSSQCHSNYSDFHIDDYTMICVKNIPVNGPCNGDSGGPLICVDKEYKEETKNDHDKKISDLKDGEFIKYLPLYTEDEDENESENDDNSSDEAKTNNKLNSSTSIIRERIRYTVFGVTSFTTDGNFGGSFCGLDQVPTIYARVSTKVEWLLSHMKMVMFSLNFEDNQQDFKNISALFGYMFRSGLSRHPNFTFQMTKYPD